VRKSGQCDSEVIFASAFRAQRVIKPVLAGVFDDAHLCKQSWAMLGLLSLLVGCTPPAPPSPDVAAQQRQFQMGCRPEDAQGYEHLLQYCDHGDLLNGGR
jgi:hypothetical protein